MIFDSSVLKYFVLFILLYTNSHSQNLILNEIMSSNTNSYYDEFGETPDWIELFNNSSENINLESYLLSDDKSNLQKWILPAIQINGNEYLLINASGKDIKTQSSSWYTIINKRDYWKYFLGTKEPPSGWKEISFNDFSWNIGQTGIGYGDDDDQTIIEEVNSVYLRKSFNISDKNNISEMFLNIDYDDGFVAYLNGKEVARANLGVNGEFISSNTSADVAIEARLYQNQKLETFFINGFDSILVDGTNILSIQVNNFGSSSSDLSAIPFLTIGLKVSEEENNVAEEIISSIPTLHTNFSLANGEETLYLSNNFGEIIDSVKLPETDSDISIGRKNGATEWFYFNQPTPGSENIFNGFLAELETPLLSFPAGFYQNGISINIENPNSLANTFYTLDGSEPDSNSNIFPKNLIITSTKIVKVKSFQNNFLPSKTITQTYFIGQNEYLPVISISTDPYNLWDYNYGIYVLGPNAQNFTPNFGANFWEDWSRPASFEYFETDKNISAQWNADIKIYGAWSRAYPQKSLAVFAKGSEGFNYKFFPNLSLDNFESIVLRNSGNDWNSTLLRDGFMQTIANDLDIDNLAYQPAVMYLNGEYWGIHNIREKVNLNYLSSHFNVNKSSIDLLELEGFIIDGNNEDYIAMTEFLYANNLSDNANYEIIKNQIDIPSFIDYNLFQIYIANTDWPGNNNKFWRSRTEKPKWRWILFDTDFGFGYMESYRHNTLKYATDPNGPEWPNPSWGTLNLRKLLENESFKTQFINRFSDLSNTILTPENINTILTSLSSKIANEIPDHIEKWNAFDLSNWEYNISIIKNFADVRISFVRQHFENYFGFSGLQIVVINNNDLNGGKIQLNSLTIEKNNWYGSYFIGSKIYVKAKANPGYEFIGWSGSSNSTEDSLEIVVNELVDLKANFQKKSNFKEIVINEINYNSNTNFDTEDWIEIYNNSNEEIDISGWIFSDEIDTNQFIIPQNTIMLPEEYLIISSDTNDLLTFHSDANNFIGNFNFNLSNGGELIRLFNKEMEIIDSVRYDDENPWVTNPDGTGSTLELKNPNLDNGYFTNWGSSTGNGTPGKENSNFVVTSVDEIKELPSKFELYQNYPNPFNPSTKIRFSLPQRSEVSLEIFNVIGEKVDELLNSTLNAGIHEIDFINTNLSSGIYFYKIKSANFVQIKKMILLK
ncbi:MAG: CotH kinase family protein [Melioribacteraceae bacterium]